MPAMRYVCKCTQRIVYTTHKNSRTHDVPAIPNADTQGSESVYVFFDPHLSLLPTAYGIHKYIDSNTHSDKLTNANTAAAEDITVENKRMHIIVDNTHATLFRVRPLVLCSYSWTW